MIKIFNVHLFVNKCVRVRSIFLDRNFQHICKSYDNKYHHEWILLIHFRRMKKPSNQMIWISNFSKQRDIVFSNIETFSFFFFFWGKIQTSQIFSKRASVVRNKNFCPGKNYWTDLIISICGLNKFVLEEIKKGRRR